MNTPILFLIYLLAFSSLVAAQELPHTIDSLKQELNTANHDTSRIKILNQLSWELQSSLPDSALYCAQQALLLAEKLVLNVSEGTQLWRSAKKGMASSYNNIGIIHANQGNYPLALEHFQKSLKIMEELGDKKGMARSYNNIGIIHANQGNYPLALENYQKSFKINEELGNKKSMASSCNNIGNIHSNQGNYPLALEHFQKSLKIREELGDKKGIAISYTCIGNIHLYQGNYPLALEHYQKSLKIYKELGDKQGMASSYSSIGLIHEHQGNYPLALEHFQKSLKIMEELGDKQGMAVSYNNIGIIHADQGNYPLALEHYQKSLKICEELGDKKGMAWSCNGIGIIHTYQGNYPLALEHFQKSLKIREELGDKNGMAVSYVNIGEIYAKYDTAEAGKESEIYYPKAIDYFIKAIIIQEEIGDKLGTIYSNNGIGNLYLQHNRGQEAFPFFEAAISTAMEIGVPKELSEAYQGISKCYAQIGKYENAYRFQSLHITLHDSIFNDSTTSKINKLESKYENEKRDKELKLLEADNKLKEETLKKQRVITWSVSGALLLLAVGAFIILRTLRQKQKMNKELEKLSIVASETENAVIIMDKDSNFEWANNAFTRLLGYTLQEFKEANGNSLFLASANPEITLTVRECIKNKKPSHYEVVNKRKDGSTFWVQSTLTPVLDDAGIVQKLVLVDSDISALKAVEQEVKNKNKDITDSINYAKRIQNAMLAPLEDIYRDLPDSFILYKPKDIVSGDFYYYARQNGKLLLAVADCTGHGVPGAFMSMVGNDLLNQLINEKGLSDPGILLTELHKGIRSALHQQKDGAETRDGMDIALVVIDKNSDAIPQRDSIRSYKTPSSNMDTIPKRDGIRSGYNCQFAGAHNSLYLFRSNQAEMEIFKADKLAIGGLQLDIESKFTTHSFTLNTGDSFYIFSDGYADQFGGPKDKRFMSGRFKDLLTSIKSKSMREQQKLLEKVFMDWRGTTPQTDDVTVAGVRII